MPRPDHRNGIHIEPELRARHDRPYAISAVDGVPTGSPRLIFSWPEPKGFSFGLGWELCAIIWSSKHTFEKGSFKAQVG